MGKLLAFPVKVPFVSRSQDQIEHDGILAFGKFMQAREDARAHEEEEAIKAKLLADTDPNKPIVRSVNYLVTCERVREATGLGGQVAKHKVDSVIGTFKLSCEWRKN